jgi:glucan phosphorylase
MKAAANAIPNVSILDGWWDEGFDKKNRNGFAIGGRNVPETLEEQDVQDALALYKVLEKKCAAVL